MNYKYIIGRLRVVASDLRDLQYTEDKDDILDDIDDLIDEIDESIDD